MQFSLYYPAQPYTLNQAWGVYAPQVYSQFGFTRHNGNDIALGADKELRAPFDYTVVRTGNQPEGGGIFFGIMSDVYDWPDGKYRVLLDMLHCEKLLCTEGQVGKAGDLLAIADNTGFSTGPHTHLQARRVLSWNGKAGTDLAWTQADHNDANGSFDLVPHWNGRYAPTSPATPVVTPQVVQQATEALQGIQTLPRAMQPALLTRLAAWLSAFLKK